jgi:hypothetical protein
MDNDFVHDRFRKAIAITYWRSGEPMPTPVNHAISDDRKLWYR